MRKTLLSLCFAALSAPAFAANMALFAGTATVAPPGDVIAATLPKIVTTINGSQVTHQVVQIPSVPMLTPAPLSSLPNVPRPPGPAVGVVFAIPGDNLSQANPDCPPPPVPSAASCPYGGTNGSVRWSGWDKVTGGTCADGSLGGWLTTAAACNAAPPPSNGGLPAGFCSPSCTLSQSGAICNGSACYVGNGSVVAYGTNGFVPVLTNQSVTQNDAAQYASTFAQTSGSSSCTTAQVTSGQCSSTLNGTMSGSQAANVANQLNSGNTTGAASYVNSLAGNNAASTGSATGIGGTTTGTGGSAPAAGGAATGIGG